DHPCTRICICLRTCLCALPEACSIQHSDTADKKRNWLDFKLRHPVRPANGCYFRRSGCDYECGDRFRGRCRWWVRCGPTFGSYCHAASTCAWHSCQQYGGTKYRCAELGTCEATCQIRHIV